MRELAWLIPLFPLAACGLIIAFGRRLTGSGAYVAVAAMALSGVLALGVFAEMLQTPEPLELNLRWMVVGDVPLDLGLRVDPLSTVMMLVVTVVGTLIFVYSIGYMHGHPRFPRFFAYVSLFGFSMLLLVLANNLLFLYAGWELVGLCSYLLIGFYFEKPSAARASLKAFVTTRVGDFFMFLGILVLFATLGTFRFEEIFARVRDGALQGRTVGGLPLLTVAAVLLFGGAVGKSAQVPLHTWLPDAMEGPSPVSALIHAATMVAAGVYLVARTFTLFLSSPGREALEVVAWVGGITALMAATMGVTQDDMKRVLAYSTISQLGLMMLGLGAGGYTAGMFHLVTHAFFKALLFLAAGSVLHAMHTNDIKAMGGLAKLMPSTYWTFVVGGLALAGVFPFSGFWSKDEILLEALHRSPALFALGALTSFFTAFYVFRVIFYVFTGTPRWAHDAHPHESPPVMTWPLWILAAFSAVIGFVGAPPLGNPFHGFLHLEGVEAAAFDPALALASLGVAGVGMLAAAAVYHWKVVPSATLRRAAGPLYVLVSRKYFVDELYGWVFVRTTLWAAGALRVFDTYIVDTAVNLIGLGIVGLARLYRIIDLHVVDGLVNLLGYVVGTVGTLLRVVQTGRAQNYLLAIALGVIVLLAVGLAR
ncbi:MAG: NADH-quinone oxidoreductase subunit L [Armatimonadota bacterium]|nr:NADH-quinone oxidoreductase subunit L [Armatimonadota bacterium]MDR7534256.1 NADH-quinone oxidoreductase subunit L [Armatimonadota bacterium]MDR7535810.1 NADH-quinone oxidoreductase subunit L [Armatimonadota bacterium]